MKSKIVLFSLIFIFMSLTGTAFAGFDEYGYNEKACLFIGSFENWENFVYGEPAAPCDMNAQEVLFLHRKWSRNFDAAMFDGQPWKDGDWQQAHFYRYLSGDLEGWTWHWMFKEVYSSVPIDGAPCYWENMYTMMEKTWLTDPEGNEQDVEFITHVRPRSLKKNT